MDGSRAAELTAQWSLPVLTERVTNIMRGRLSLLLSIYLHDGEERAAKKLVETFCEPVYREAGNIKYRGGRGTKTEHDREELVLCEVNKQFHNLTAILAAVHDNAMQDARDGHVAVHAALAKELLDDEWDHLVMLEEKCTWCVEDGKMCPERGKAGGDCLIPDFIVTTKELRSKLQTLIQECEANGKNAECLEHRADEEEDS